MGLIKCHGCHGDFLPAPKNRRFCEACKGNAKRKSRNSRGICARCGEQAVVPNRTQCAECAKYGRLVLDKLYEKRLAQGLCAVCGLNPLHDSWDCTDCELKKAKRILKSRHSFDESDMSRYFTQMTCDWCGLPFKGSKRPHVDHDHRCCEKDSHCWYCIRGFLHYDCNQRVLVAHEFIEKECGFVSPQLAAYRLKFPVPRIRL